MDKETVYMKKPKTISALKAIRQKCLDCSTTARDVRACNISKCPLWPYRFGVTPDTAIKTLANYDVKLLED